MSLIAECHLPLKDWLEVRPFLNSPDLVQFYFQWKLLKYNSTSFCKACPISKEQWEVLCQITHHNLGFGKYSNFCWGDGVPPKQLHGHLLFYSYLHFNSLLRNFLLDRSIFKQLQRKTIIDSPNRVTEVQIFVLKHMARSRIIIPHRTRWGTVPRLDCEILIVRNARSHQCEAAGSHVPWTVSLPLALVRQKGKRGSGLGRKWPVNQQSWQWRYWARKPDSSTLSKNEV